MRSAELAASVITVANVATSGRREAERLKFMKFCRMDQLNL
ncbi:hypothetical protein DSOL_1951 [Desulfosporosinus metallidurans]|uniref:Uncharacterized protein n=1 Tax=Desulfosporosinus metallidurans TaxID=1888891 RepID=A0A1Q8QXK5_9FIRM|nr:hypothetical protein DSOL_1951 [Desulfosporosinus metallidurans]